MSESTPLASTYEHALMDERVSHGMTKQALDAAHERNILVIEKLREIKESRWYRVGKFFGWVP